MAIKHWFGNCTGKDDFYDVGRRLEIKMRQLKERLLMFF